MSFAVLSPPTEHSPRPLLGREHELRWLLAGLRTAQRGAGALIAVEGPSGTGKSCLLREAQRRAEALDMLVLGTRALDGEQRRPHALARRLCAPAEGDPSTATGDLAQIAIRLAAERSLLIVVDDVDRSDRESLRALAALALRLDDLGGVALLVSRRYDAPSCVDPVALDALVGDPAAIRIRLGPLGPADSAAIVEASVAAQPEAEFAAAVQRLTAGNAFLVSELALGLGERGIVPVDAQVRALLELALPGVARSVRARAADVDEDAEWLVSALAVLGEDATLSATGALTGLSYLDAADRCGQLVTAGVLAAHDPPRFAQPLLLHAIYDTIAPRERLRLHREAAHALVRSGAPIDAIARHLLAAAPARDPWAARTLQTAARAARARGAIMEACGYLQRGVAEGVDELQYELERDLGLAEATLGDPGAGDRLQRAYGLAGSARARAQIGLALARLSASIGATSRAREWCLTALAQLHSSEDVELSARLHVELIAASTAEPEAPSPAEVLRAERPPDGDPSGCLMIALEADSAVAAGRSHAAAVALARRALSSPRVWRERGSLIPHLAVEVLVTAEHLVEAKAHWDAGLAATDSLGLTWDAAAIRAHRAGTLLRLGAVDAAIDDAQAALDTVGDGTGPVRACAAATLAEALLELGRVDAAAAALDDVRRRPAPYDARIVRASARILISQRRYADALAELDMTAQTSTASPMLIPWRSLAAECHVALGDRERARALATEELGLARDFGAPAARARALRALALSFHGTDALTPLKEAARILEESPAQLERAHTLVELGIALSATGEIADSREALRCGMAIAHRCNAAAVAARARDALVAAGGRPRRPVHDGLDGLTRAERSVAELAAAGLTNKEIGNELYVTLNTVATHLRNVYRKLNISSRAQLPTHLEPRARPSLAKNVDDS